MTLESTMLMTSEPLNSLQNLYFVDLIVFRRLESLGFWWLEHPV